MLGRIETSERKQREMKSVGVKDKSEESRREGIIEKDVWNERATGIENRLSVDRIPTGIIAEKNNNIA